MLEHIVLFRWKAATNPATEERIMQELLNLKGLIPEIIDISAGRNISERSRGYTHGIVVRFRDSQSLDAYQVHAEHQRVVKEWVRPHLEDILAVDYEF
ncbi:MAG: Dabb family protein [Oligoflexus sp.]|jgi:hypothetical protein